MNLIGDGERNGISVLLEAAQSLGDHPGAGSRKLLPERNDFHEGHEYARSPPERAYSTKETRVREKKSDDRILIPPKERQRPGGRMEHNRLEKDRRAQLKDNFTKLKDVVPTLRDKKSSNQAILRGALRYIQGCKQEQEKYKRELHNLSNEKIQRMKELKAAKEKFEEVAGYDADEYLNNMMMSDEDDKCSYSTWSATEGPDNLRDLDEELEEDGGAPQAKDVDHSGQLMSPVLVHSSSQFKGIPHPVIKPVPGNHRSETESSLPGVPRTTLKKVQAKITSTKQTITAVQDASARNAIATTAPQPVTMTLSMPSMGPRPSLPNYSPGLPGGMARMPVSQAQGRVVGHSLLTHSPGPMVPLFQTTTPPPASGVVVPGPIPANPALLSSGVPPFNHFNHPISPVYRVPRVIVSTSNNHRGFILNHHPQNVIMVSNPLSSPSSSPAVSSHVAL